MQKIGKSQNCLSNKVGQFFEVYVLKALARSVRNRPQKKMPTSSAMYNNTILMATYLSNSTSGTDHEDHCNTSMWGVRLLVAISRLLPCCCQVEASMIPWSRIPSSMEGNFTATEVLADPMSEYKCALKAQTTLTPTNESGLSILDGNGFQFDYDTRTCTLGKMAPVIDDYQNMRKETQAEGTTKIRTYVNRTWITHGKVAHWMLE